MAKGKSQFRCRLCGKYRDAKDIEMVGNGIPLCREPCLDKWKKAEAERKMNGTKLWEEP